ncbi:DUF2225 domain-containing protein [Priestia abyssalis]|uniref:DUF2225 domain-containing protein n=1 Tax=Priestia abyssalis TaxID=1221450 RepID=UPI0009959E00|nr:DUF2225 domain-containing protein [Priestia abyssalis]
MKKCGDFFTHYENEDLNPTLYHVNVCPHCGFSATEDFSPYFAPKSLDYIKEKVCSQWNMQNYGEKRGIEQTINSHKLAIYRASLKKEKHITIAGLLLRLAWLYRIKEQMEKEHRFLAYARQEYIESYSTDDFRGTQMGTVRILYIIGELSKRIGDEKQAALYFSKIIQKHAQSGDQKIVEMASERWCEIREQQKTAM